MPTDTRGRGPDSGGCPCAVGIEKVMPMNWATYHCSLPEAELLHSSHRSGGMTDAPSFENPPGHRRCRRCWPVSSKSAAPAPDASARRARCRCHAHKSAGGAVPHRVSGREQNRRRSLQQRTPIGPALGREEDGQVGRLRFPLLAVVLSATQVRRSAHPLKEDRIEMRFQRSDRDVLAVAQVCTDRMARRR